jgi:transposase
MSNISMRKISEIFRQRFELNLSYREIATSLNLAVGTISEYMARAKTAKLDWDKISKMSEEELYNKLFLPSTSSNKCNRTLPDWTYIHKELRKKGVTQHLLWREYREQQQDGVCYSQFCHLYSSYKKMLSPVMRQQHKAGEKSFVDYSGMRMEWIDPKSGEIYKAEIFVGCLGASQLIFAEATATQQLEDWINSHINMFEFYGGVTEMIIPDNLKSAVTKSHKYDPDINANYQHFSEHYGVAIVPARAGAPKDKAKVENAVGIVEKQILAPLRNITFTSLGEINSAIKKQLHIVNNQKFQKMEVSRQQLFESLDKPALKELPPARYQYAIWKKATINIDYHFVYDNHYYSVPYKYIHKKVDLCATNKTVECYLDGDRIAIHEISFKKYGFTTLKEHMPKNHKEHAEFSMDRIQSWAKKIGNDTLTFVEHMLAARAFPQQAYRACLGLLRLSNIYTEARLEKACNKALTVGATRYQQVADLLKNNLEEVSISTNNLNITEVNHDNIRGANFYQ